MSDTFRSAAETLHDAEFGTPFHLHKDGTLRKVVDFPESYIRMIDSDGNDIFEGIEHGYAPVWGLTGQHGYSGPIMHESEFVSAGMLQGIVERLGECVIYLAAVCDYSDAAYEDPDVEYGEAFGWAVLARDVYDEEMYD